MIVPADVEKFVHVATFVEKAAGTVACIVDSLIQYLRALQHIDLSH